MDDLEGLSPDEIHQLRMMLRAQTPGHRLSSRFELTFQVHQDGTPDYEQLNDELRAGLLREAESEVPEGEFQLVRTVVGRGAAAEGVALVLGGAVAAVYAVGAIESFLQGAERIHRLVRRLAPTYGRPLLSLGTVQALVLLDAINTFGAAQNVRIIGATELTGGIESDTNPTESDIFGILLAERDNSASYHYLVDGRGDVVLAVEIDKIPDGVAIYNGVKMARATFRNLLD